MLSNTPYLLIPIGIISIFLYLLTFLLVRLGLMSLLLHRKIWNAILLITFFVTVILGLLLAIQINYKLEWGFVKTALKWHVDFAIGLSFVAIFHFLWHWRYYINLFKSTKIEIKQTEIIGSEINESNLKYLILLSGFIGTVVQVLLMRQITTVFEGNELMMAWTLGVWMLLTGIGAYIGRFRKNTMSEDRLLAFILFILGVLPVVFSVIIVLLKNQIFPVGVMISPLSFFVLLLIVLTPICLLIGFVYALLVRIFCNQTEGFIKVYAFESVGSFVGGLVVSFVFIQWLTILQSLIILLLIISVSLFVSFKSWIYLVASVFTLIFLLLASIFPVETGLKSFLFVNQKVLDSKETYYGNITITESAGQYNIYSNGSLLFTTDNTILNEENVHYAMLQKRNPENILIVSGGVSGMIEEILKYPSVKSVDYLEMNPQLVRMATKYKPLPNDSRLKYIEQDGRRFIRITSKTYDVAIFAIPEPSSIQINRFYTQEFLQILKKRISEDAIVIYGLPSVGNYISPLKADIEASVYQTLKRNFKNVEIITGEKDYLLASNNQINLRISEVAMQRGVRTSYVNSYYIDDFSIQQRGDLIKKSIERKRLINTDSKPVPVFFETLKFASQYSGSNWFMIIIPILLLIPMFFFPSASKGMYVAGFSASSIELLLIFFFQIVFGNVYSAIGLIIAIFMGGLVLGSMLSRKFNIVKKHFIASQALLALFMLILPLVWYWQKGLTGNFLILTIFFVLTIIPSGIVGFQYVVATKMLSNDTVKSAPATYAADLVGSALGIIAVTVFLLPLIGLINTCFVIAGLNFLAMGLTYFTGR